MARNTTLAVYEAISRWWDAHDYGPSIRDILEMTGLSSTSVVNYHIKKLIEDGSVVYEPGKSRTLRPVGIKIETPMMIGVVHLSRP